MVKSYGNYLPAGFTNISGSDVDAAANCDTSKGDVCPDVTVDTSAKDSKWSWKDLKNTVKSGINAAKTAYDTYKTVKNTVETTIDQAKKIGTAISHMDGGLTGVLDTLGEVSIHFRLYGYNLPQKRVHLDFSVNFLWLRSG